MPKVQFVQNYIDNHPFVFFFSANLLLVSLPDVYQPTQPIPTGFWNVVQMILMCGSRVMSFSAPQISAFSFIWPFTSNPDVRSVRRRHTHELYPESGIEVPIEMFDLWQRLHKRLKSKTLHQRWIWMQPPSFLMNPSVARNKNLIVCGGGGGTGEAKHAPRNQS